MERVNVSHYQSESALTARHDFPVPTTARLRLLDWAMGLAGETGELVDHIKKHVFHGHELDIQHIAEELGDIGWYRAQMATDLALDLDDIEAANLAKLVARYPAGFTEERSLGREEGAEAEAMTRFLQPIDPRATRST